MQSNTPEFSVPPSAPAPSGNQRMMAIASLVLGVINLCAWFFRSAASRFRSSALCWDFWG
jgi:hypothetical protein